MLKIQSISHTLSDQSSATNKQLSKAESLRNIQLHCSPGHEINSEDTKIVLRTV